MRIYKTESEKNSIIYKANMLIDNNLDSFKTIFEVNYFITI